MYKLKYLNLLALVFLFSVSCDIKDKSGNRVFVPDVFENFNKKVEKADTVVAPTPIPTPAPSPTPQKIEKTEAKTIVKKEKNDALDYPIESDRGNVQGRIIEAAEKYLYVREVNGNNRSPEIDKWNKFSEVPLGSYWCASFVNWCYYEAGVKNRPKGNAWTPSWFSNARTKIKFEQLQEADTIGYYYSGMGRVAHIGIYTGKKQGRYYITIEGNTSEKDSVDTPDRDGKGNTGGVYKKLRNAKLLSQERNKFSRWY